MVGSEKMLTVEVFVRWRDVDYMVDHGWIQMMIQNDDLFGTRFMTKKGGDFFTRVARAWKRPFFVHIHACMYNDPFCTATTPKMGSFLVYYFCNGTCSFLVS